MISYFPHDSNARNSAELLPIRMKYGVEGYGIYFMILERLREEENYMSVKDYNMIAFDLRVDAQKVKSIVEDFGLFTFTEDGECFYSEGFLKRMEIKDERSKKRAEAGKRGAVKRWQKNSKAMAMPSKKNSNAIAMPLESDSNANGEPMANDSKKRKENKTKENQSKKEIKDDSAVSEQVRNVITYLNSQTGKSFKANASATKKVVQARLNEGYTVENLKKVVDNKCAEWMNDEKMNQYLRPTTLFATSKIEGYLNQNFKPKSTVGRFGANSFNDSFTDADIPF